MRSEDYYIRGPRVIFNSFVFCGFGEILRDLERDYGFSKHSNAHVPF